MSVLGNFDLAHVVVAFAAAHDARARAALAAVSPAFRDAASRLTGLDLEFGGNSDAGLARLARDPRACSTAMQGVIAVRVAPGAGLRSHALLVRVLRRAGAGGGLGLTSVTGVTLHGPWLRCLVPRVATLSAAGWWHAPGAAARLPPGARDLDLSQLPGHKPAHPCPDLLAGVPGAAHVTLRGFAGARLAALPPGLVRLALEDTVLVAGGDGGPVVSLPAVCSRN